MTHVEISAIVHQWANDSLVWVGFGTLVGLAAKAIMPGRDPGGAVATLGMGMGGSVIGCALLAYFTGAKTISPISPLGFVVGTAGAFILLFFYRLLSNRVVSEGDGRDNRVPYFTRRRRRALIEQ